MAHKHLPVGRANPSQSSIWSSLSPTPPHLIFWLQMVHRAKAPSQPPQSYYTNKQPSWPVTSTVQIPPQPLHPWPSLKTTMEATRSSCFPCVSLHLLDYVLLQLWIRSMLIWLYGPPWCFLWDFLPCKFKADLYLLLARWTLPAASLWTRFLIKQLKQKSTQVNVAHMEDLKTS